MRTSTLALTVLLVAAASSAREEMRIEEFTGVVTLHLIPAKVIRINEIIEDPAPGTSHIGDEGILVDVEENPEVMANWTVVRVRYYRYHEPKIITYRIMEAQYEIAVEHHAVSLEAAGDLSGCVKGE